MEITSYDHKKSPHVLLIHKDATQNNAIGRAIANLKNELDRRNITTLFENSYDDAQILADADNIFDGFLFGWEKNSVESESFLSVLNSITKRNAKAPIFILTASSEADTIPLEILKIGCDFIWLLEDTVDFIGGRITSAIERYQNNILPPMFGALEKFSKIHEYSWHTPGHTGGTAFLKSPIGRKFFEFYGENLFRTDLSISVEALGSLLDHSGPIGESEKHAAKIFGAHRSYHVTNGSSTSNRVILMASVTRNEICLCDRNCHKSVIHALTMAGAIPVYMMPMRNRYGIIGPIPAVKMSPESIQHSLENNQFVQGSTEPSPKHAILTNSTYDGICYNVNKVEALLGQSVDRLQFDEAWFGYARFNPLYRNMYAMRGESSAHDQTKPSLFATQSTHKLLAAFSQASYIHVRDGRNPIAHERFNESYMMHASTSPNYAIIASNDVAASMMEGVSGEALTGTALHEAISFRRMLARIYYEQKQKNEIFFTVWQPDEVTNPITGESLPFYLASEELLLTEPSCWMLKPNEAWHGFGAIEHDFCMLDPIKVTILTPGVSRESNSLAASGIPAVIVTQYLADRGIIVEKTSDFGILFLFSIGITKGKWGALVTTLLDFQRDYEQNMPLDITLPSLLKAHPTRYQDIGLKDFCTEMFGAMKKLKTIELLNGAFNKLPEVNCSPAAAYEKLVHNEIEMIPIAQMAERTLATAIVPYPPGIPLLMPGENVGGKDDDVVQYLLALEKFDAHFPGFAHDIHGITVKDNRYMAAVIK